MGRNIVITPNRSSTGSTQQPNISFSGLSAGTISLLVEDDGSLVYDGVNGSLFSISDNKDGLLHSVNDVSGLPILQVWDDNKVVLGVFNNPALTISGSVAFVGPTATTASILHISGGSITYKDGNQGANKVLVSDTNGIASWQTLSFTGGTVSGATNFTGGLTGNTISATTYQNLPIDIRVTGGTYFSGTTTLKNNLNNTFTVNGFYAPYELKNYSGSTFGERLQNAINSVPSGVTIDCNDTIGISLTINSSISITKPVTIFLGNNLITANVGTGNNVFNISASSVTIKGVSSSSKSSDLGGRSRITMTSGNWHIYSVGNNALRFEDFDCIGIQSTNYKFYSGTTTPKTVGTYAFNNDGSGGIFIAEGDPYVVGGGNTFSKLFIQNVYIDGTMNSGILLLGGITSRIENCRISNAAGHGMYVGASTTTLSLINNYVSSAVLAGICLDGVATSVLISNATEASGIGLWLKSCQSVEIVGHYSEACGTRDTTRMPENTGLFIANSSTGATITDIGSDNLTLFRGTSYVTTGGRNIYLPNPYSNNPGSPNTQGASTQTRHILVRGNTREIYLLNPRCTSSVGYGGTPRFDIGIETLSTEIPRDVNLFFNPTLDGTITPIIPGKYITQIDLSGETTVVLDQGSNTRIQSGANIWSYDIVSRTIPTGNTYTTLPNDKMVVFTGMTTSKGITLLTPPSGSNVLYTFKDESGAANTINKVTLSGQSSKTINGLSSYDIITTPNGYGSVYYNGVNWNVINDEKIDLRLTGGTYSNGTILFTNNSGQTFNVTGLTSTDTFVTGFTYSNNTFTISQNQGKTALTATINTVTGLTVSGNIIVTGGTVGIGTSSPQDTLHIKGNDNVLTLEGTDHVYMNFYPDGYSAGRKGWFGYPNSGDTNLSICNQTNSGLMFRTNDTDRMFITSGGTVGIGNGSPTQLLDVEKAITGVSARFRGSVEVGDFSGNDAQIQIGQSRTAIGNAFLDLIGDTTNPFYGLRLIRWGAINGANALSQLTHKGTGALEIVTEGAAPIDLKTTSTSRLYINSAGNVGINTSSFGTESFDVNGTSRLRGIVSVGDKTSGTTGIEIGGGRTANGFAYLDLIGDTTNPDYGLRLIRNSGGTNTNSILSHRGTGTLSIGAQDAGSLQFVTTDSARIFITSTGGTGIGTITPTELLDVARPITGISARFRGSVDVGDFTGGDAQIRIGQGRTINGNAFLDLIGDPINAFYGLRLIRWSATTANALSQLTHKGTGALEIVTEGAAPIDLRTNATSRLYITSVGNVGIGTTDPQSLLHVKGNSAVLTLEGTDHMYMQFYPDGYSSGRKGWFGYGSSADDNITLTNQTVTGGTLFKTNDIARMFISASGNSGNVGINTITPNSMLQVIGDVAIGQNTVTVGTYSHAEGSGSTSSGNYSHAEGNNTVSIGTYSHAEGRDTTSYGTGSHSEGRFTIANGSYSHSGGQGLNLTNKIISSGSTSFVHYRQTIANGILGTYSDFSTILGGTNHNISSHSESAIILGGDNHRISGNTTVTSINTSIIGGVSNSIYSDSSFFTAGTGMADNSSIIGGDSNTIYGHKNSSIIGGSGNTIHFDLYTYYNHTESILSSVKCGITGATISSIFSSSGSSITYGNQSAIIGGTGNKIRIADNSVIIGGTGNQMSGVTDGTVIIGGLYITGRSANTVYVSNLNINTLFNATSLQTDSFGKVIAGTSDIRLKENINQLQNSLSIVKNLRGVSFEYTEESNMKNGVQYGFIAQEVQEFVPDIVRTRSKGDDMLSLNYDEIVPLLVESIKEMSKTIDELKEEIRILKNK